MNDIVIADRHALYRHALCDYIACAAGDEIAVSGYEDFKSMMRQKSGAMPDLMIVSEGLPDMDEFLKAGADKIALMIPRHTDAEIRPGDAQGLAGIFPKSLSCKMILSGIREILAGRRFFPEERDYAFFADDGHSPHRPPEDFGLTAREKDVLSYLVKGQSNKDIARVLDLQVVTVKLHVRGICRKLGASNRTQAALAAREGGWG